MFKVNSSNIEAIDHSEGKLTVVFKGGSVYEYLNVPTEIAMEMIEEGSKPEGSVGRYLNQNIKGKFEYRQAVNRLQLESALKKLQKKINEDWPSSSDVILGAEESIKFLKETFGLSV